MTSLHIQQIPAFDDNYLWLIHNSQNAIIVDPGDAVPVQAYLNQHGLTLCAILVTHHHPDHIGGIAELQSHAKRPVPVYGPKADRQSGRIPSITHGCIDNEVVRIAELGIDLTVMDVPGHTSTHIAYHCAALNSLFCGDTLFAGGCGRLFEGTPLQMLTSLKRIATLPKNTKIYCAHEYTLSNLRFAMAVEPHNTDLQDRYQLVSAAREQGVSTVPSVLATELLTNPFMRSTSSDIIHTLQQHHKLDGPTDEVSVFAAVRLWKNTF